MMNTIQNFNANTLTGADSASASRYLSVGITQKQNLAGSSPSVSAMSQSTDITISDEALQKLGLAQKSQNSTGARLSGQNDLTSQELKEVKYLKSRDQQVHDHERAHMMAGGDLVRKGATYQYQTGPDGKRYAVGGEVSIDTSPVQDDPEATITKMQQVRRAALAPADPSAQDRAVATSASETEAQARQEISQQSDQDK